MIDKEKLKQSIETAARIERVEAEIAEYKKEIEKPTESPKIILSKISTL